MEAKIREQLAYVQGMLDTIIWLTEDTATKECVDCIVGKISEILQEDSNATD